MVTPTNLDEFKSCYKILNDDMNDAELYETSNNSGYAKRALVRTLFAFIEGNLHHLRQLTLENYTELKECTNAEMFEQDTLDKLREEKFEKDDIGRKNPIKNFQKLKESVGFVLEQYAISRATRFELNKTDPRWCSFCEAIAIRHRITHPKSSKLLTITPSEINVIKNAHNFFFDELKRLMSDCENVSQSF